MVLVSHKHGMRVWYESIVGWVVCAIHPFTHVDVPLIDDDDAGDLSKENTSLNFFGGLFWNVILVKTIATFNHSDNPSPWEKTSELDVLPQKLLLRQEFDSTFDWSLFVLIYQSLEKLASLGLSFDELIKEDIKVDDGAFAHVISSLWFCLFMVGDKQFHAY